jgi:3-oxoacyl-[acyl-carrier-protein] synthase III
MMGTSDRRRSKSSHTASSFLSYHGENDSSHIEKMNDLMESDLVNQNTAEQIVKTAKVVARLYILQLEELNNV